jgi:NAD(P)H-hydrate epimerase
MTEADRLAVDGFGIELLQMMEHAGSSLAELCNALAPPGPVTVVAGGGNNGGGGLCAARHLIARGREVTVVLATERVGPAPAHHLRTLHVMGVEPIESPDDDGVVIDALVGYGLAGPLRGRAAELAAWMAGRFVVSLDFPSGHGFPGAVSPDATLTLALPKAGLHDVAPLFLADLGLPPALWARMGLDVPPLFGAGRILEVAG